jgi:hypothetical protein
MSVTQYEVTKAAMRPNSTKEECFFCRQPVGNMHKYECPLVERKATVRATIVYDITPPAHWDKDAILFHRHESSWCASNMIDELEKEECLCGRVTFEIVAMSPDTFLREEQ